MPSWADAELRLPPPSPQIMVMATALPLFTVADLEALPDDGNRYELLNGVILVTPQAGLPHQVVATRLLGELTIFLKPEANVLVCGPGVLQVPPSIHLEPDILVGRWPVVPRWNAVDQHWLAGEVSGVSSRIYDRDYKRDAYLRLGVKEVWLVDLDLRRVLVSRLDGGKDVPYDSTVTWRSPGGRELPVDIPHLFRGLPVGYHGL